MKKLTIPDAVYNALEECETDARDERTRNPENLQKISRSKIKRIAIRKLQLNRQTVNITERTERLVENEVNNISDYRLKV